MRTRAKPNADIMITRKVDNEDSLSFRTNGADASVMDEVYDEAKAFEGDIFKESAVP